MNIELRDWKLQQLESEFFKGQNVSSIGFDDSDWLPVTVPNSLVGNYVEAGLFPDPYVGTNMKDIPGYKTERKEHFAFFRMPQGSPFRKSFWYRTTIEIEQFEESERFRLALDGINYRANIWVNGKRVAGSDYVSGTYRQFDFDISYWIKGGKNCIAIELTPQEPDELGMTFIDWSPVPPDDSAGIWQPVRLYSTGVVSIAHPTVRTTLDETLSRADLELEFTLQSRTKQAITTEVTASINNKVITIPVELRSLEEKTVTINSDEYPELIINNPNLWWPHDMGEQPLYPVEISAGVDHVISSSKNFSFGIREITSEINEYGARQFYVNRKPISIKGTAWSPDLLLRQDFNREEIDIAYLKQMNLNTVRLEGKLATDNFWDICDREGVLVMAGWPCCTHWEKWDRWKPDDYVVAKESQRSQLLRLRNHPSFAAWFYGSDFPPIEPVEKMYLKELDELTPSLVRISSAAAFTSKLTGKAGVKMSGRYGYVPPSYWYNRDMPGFANSFNTEAGPDSSLPRFESLCKMIPDESERFVGSDSWNHHAGLASFDDTELMNSTLETRYGADRSNLKQFLDISQLNSYEAWRGMYEAYNRFYPEGTGIIGWMMNGHWPSLLWQMYDYWLFPTGGFYGTRKAGAPVTVQYSYDDHSIWAINNSYEPFSGDVSIDLFNSRSELISNTKSQIQLKPMERKEISSSIFIDETLYFLSLKVLVESETVHRNFYWLSNTVEEFKKERIKSEWFYRPLIKGTDFSDLLTIETTELSAKITTIDQSKQVITLNNRGSTIALSVLLDFVDIKGEPLSSILWSDNYLCIPPNESVEIVADTKFLTSSESNKLRITGLNVGELCL